MVRLKTFGKTYFRNSTGEGTDKTGQNYTLKFMLNLYNVSVFMKRIQGGYVDLF